MDSNYLIYSASADANIRQQQITDACNFDDGVTTKYADVLQHPTQSLWALIVHPLYLQYFTQDEILSAVNLSSDWFQQPIVLSGITS